MPSSIIDTIPFSPLRAGEKPCQLAPSSTPNELPKDWRDLIPEDEVSSLLVAEMFITKPARAFVWFLEVHSH